MEQNDIKKAIECIVFVSDQPVSVDKLQQVFTEIERADIKKYLKELIQEWESLGRGIVLEEVAGGYQFRTDTAYSEYITNFNKRIKKFRLSRAALEVLAIIAYKQPVTRVEVESIRGVDSSGVINALLERRILEIKGRKEVIGKPFLYGTTGEFLEVFGLKSLSDLPTLKEIDEISKNLDPGITSLPEELS
ncbi:MAG TPA: SMC-Scp complex subunit ScpB [Thermodesulfobacteriota bacterium]|nr:SMC-Scp complex subunit ScpB [Thermodesulfobacteriota bacterium]